MKHHSFLKDYINGIFIYQSKNSCVVRKDCDNDNDNNNNKKKKKRETRNEKSKNLKI